MGFIQIVEEKRNDKGNVKKSEQKKVQNEGEGLTAKIKILANQDEVTTQLN